MLEMVFGKVMYKDRPVKDLMAGNGNIKVKSGQSIEFWLWSWKWRREKQIQFVLALGNQLLDFQEFS